jgi:general secretion pathway protein D
MAQSFFRSRHPFARALMAVGLVAFLSSCQLAKNQFKDFDRAAELDQQAYRDAFAPNYLPPEQDANIPDFQSVVSTPEELKLPSPLVTVSVNQTVSLRDLMFELAHQADVDIELDPQIRGSIIFTAREKPFDRVIERICDMSGLRYTYENEVLRIELDRPFVKNYIVDYIGSTRKATGSISTEISLSSAAGDTAESGGGGGSSSSVTSDLEGDLWGELSDGLDQILTSSDTYISLATMADPVARPVNPLSQPQPYDPNAENPVPPPLPGDPRVAPLPPSTPATLNISTPPGEPLVPSAPATFAITKQSGIVSVFASGRQHKLVKQYLDDFRRRATTQILIEARVLQVELSDEFATGIDWSTFNLTGLANFTPSFPIPSLSPTPSGNFTGVINAGDIQAAVQAISRFGTVRALSSPRVTVLNNQPAIVNVAQNNVYFEFDVQITEATVDLPARTTVDSTQKGLPEGVLMTVVPTANPDTGEILLTVRPSVSSITNFVPDPTIPLTLALNGLDPSLAPPNQIPQVSVQEIDSVLRMQSGQMMVMGGLMRDTNSVEVQGVPVLSAIPILGKAFSSHQDSISKSELVIFMRAKIVPNANVHDTDRKFYNTFGQDRRPARM